MVRGSGNTPPPTTTLMFPSFIRADDYVRNLLGEIVLAIVTPGKQVLNTSAMKRRR